MEKRVNLFMQGMVLFISLLLSVLIAVSITTQREDENRELLEDIRLHQQAPDSSYQRLRRGPVEKPELYDTVILQA
jgi:cytoskeletal protein RodZ